MKLSRRIEEARAAFEKRDLEASAKSHTPERIAEATHREKHGGASSQYIGELVYGGLDGIITTFAVVSGVAGAQLGSEILLILGLANLFVSIPAEASFPVSIALSALALFGLGAAKVLVTQRSVLRSGSEMLLVGGLAASVAYAVGALLKGIGG